MQPISPAPAPTDRHIMRRDEVELKIGCKRSYIYITDENQAVPTMPAHGYPLRRLGLAGDRPEGPSSVMDNLSRISTKGGAGNNQTGYRLAVRPDS